MLFKLQHPSDVFSRVILLEYMRELGVAELYYSANKKTKKKFFYKFLNEGSNEEAFDFNWEFLLFDATLLELEILIKPFLKEVMEIEEKRKLLYKDMAKYKEAQAQAEKQVDVNLIDIARADLRDNKSIKGLNGEKLI